MKHVKITLRFMDNDHNDYITIERQCKEYRYDGNFLELSFTGGFGLEDKTLMVPLNNILCMEEI